MGVVAKKLWADSGLTPDDIQTAFLYDHFTPFVLVQLEELGFCGRGEAKDFATIENLSLGGRLPINTSGGLLGEAYIHGMNGITEAVRQIRGTSCNQVDDVEHVLVTVGHRVPDQRSHPGALVLRRPRSIVFGEGSVSIASCVRWRCGAATTRCSRRSGGIDSLLVGLHVGGKAWINTPFFLA